LEIAEDRVVAMESVTEGRRLWILIPLDGTVSSPNPDAINGRKQNSPIMLRLKFYYPMSSREPGFNWNDQILLEQNKALQRDPGGSNGEYNESVQETR
jgi:hypothetical protein